jgi:hypothetical protein
LVELAWDCKLVSHDMPLSARDDAANRRGRSSAMLDDNGAVVEAVLTGCLPLELDYLTRRKALVLRDLCAIHLPR